MPSQASLANLKPAWQPGKSGYEGGAPRSYREVLRITRVNSPAAAKMLVACVNDDSAPWPSRIAAASLILDRAWGKPKEHLQLDGDGIAALRIEFVNPDAVARDPGMVIAGLAEPAEGPPGPGGYPTSGQSPKAAGDPLEAPDTFDVQFGPEEAE